MSMNKIESESAQSWVMRFGFHYLAKGEEPNWELLHENYNDPRTVSEEAVDEVERPVVDILKSHGQMCRNQLYVLPEDKGGGVYELVAVLEFEDDGRRSEPNIEVMHQIKEQVLDGWMDRIKGKYGFDSIESLGKISTIHQLGIVTTAVYEV